ncbi:hypothetical protein RJ55_03100 [Drechmeria coniospora]|nr:hypothetical protein RJ55_03100 [Drechmeria coniospora]
MMTKGSHYVELLELARCDGNWDAVPELVRKVRKHAPERTCLTLAAETECVISKATTAGARTSGVVPDLDIYARVPQLLTAIDEERVHVEEKFQAQVCVGWLHWVVGEYSLAIVRLPKRLEEFGTGLDPASLTFEWTHVCALKSAYLRANCLMRESKRKEALAALESVVPALNRALTSEVRKQLRYWSELFLTELCLLLSDAIDDGEAPLDDALTLAPLRNWARYWEAMRAPKSGGYGFKGSVPRRQIWLVYYMALSCILKNNLPYEAGFVEGLPLPTGVSWRSQLRAELKYVEMTYRTMLLAETHFPRADEERSEVEALVKQVMENWSILCGRGWRDDDLGHGGRAAISRGVLDTLYSAATRTYHSNAILRSLFTVHLSVAEFDLAFKALDSYLGIVKKSKARADKTGEVEANMDDDGTILEIMSLGIMALCRYGNEQAGEKARHLGGQLEDWLSKLTRLKDGEDAQGRTSEDMRKSDSSHPVAPSTLALAWQAIGLSHAHWSRLTHEAGSRMEIQSKAIRCLRQSLAAERGRPNDVRGCFCLALLLAERRELTTAVELTKTVLLSSKKADESGRLQYGSHWQERSLIPLWHLLALLMSARQDYAMAFMACEAAFEQFEDPTMLFGSTDANFRSEHLNDAGVGGALPESRRGLVDEMDDGEREAILEVKMTQLALTELTEGPETAVNSSHELLTLFSRLFGNVTAEEVTGRHRPAPPKSSGTLRSMRGSIFGTKVDRSRPPTRDPSASTISEKSGVMVSRPATAQGKPMIQVTEEENGNHDGGPKSRRASSTHGLGSAPRRRNSLKKRNRSGSEARMDSQGGTLQEATASDGDTYFTSAAEPDLAGAFFLPSKPSGAALLPSNGKAAVATATGSKSAECAETSAEGSSASPPLLPLVQFSKEKQRAQRVTILVKVWLTIAGFYRRAQMLDDAKGAIAEAQKLVQALESEASGDSLRGRGGGSQAGAGWAETKSIDELWGDVWSELGLVSVAQDDPVTGRSDFEYSLTHWPNHPVATVGLCNILLDIYSEEILPTPAMAPLESGMDGDGGESWASSEPSKRPKGETTEGLPSTPLGLGPSFGDSLTPATRAQATTSPGDDGNDDELPAPYKASRLPLVDRLAARDRAFTLLSGLTRLGSGWSYSDAWFALARAHEESGQADKAKEVLWWCVELEEAMGVRDVRCLGGGRYVT